MFRAKCRWIHESSSGNPATPARRRSISAKRTSGKQAATATTRSSRSPKPPGSAPEAAGTARRLLADQGVAGVAHRLLAHGEHVEEPAVGNLDLHETGGPRRGGGALRRRTDEAALFG